MPTFDVPPDFDPDGGWDEGGHDIGGIASDMGWSDWSDILRDRDGANPENVRPGGYSTPQEAIFMFYELGLLDFIELFWDEKQGLWFVEFTYTND